MIIGCPMLPQRAEIQDMKKNLNIKKITNELVFKGISAPNLAYSRFNISQPGPRGYNSD
jgi:hypothetical protein